MNEIKLIVKEQIESLGIIFRMSRYENKATFQGHYLGLAWQILNPLIQIGIYYLIFGVGVNGGRDVDGVPFIAWMLIGISCWFFINSSITGCSKSIYQQIGMVSKMKFPVSTLPAINIASNLSSFFVMLGVSIIILLFFGIYPTIYWLQFFYYFFCLIVFLFFFGLLNATISTLVRDYHTILQSVLRILFFLSGAVWNIEERNFPDFFIHILELNPIFYIISGFRDTFLSRQFVFEQINLTLFFWACVMVIAIIGTHLHLKFRAKFVDFL